MKRLTPHSRAVLINLSLVGIDKIKEEIKEFVDMADCNASWDLVNLKIIETREAQHIVNQLSETNKSGKQ